MRERAEKFPCVPTREFFQPNGNGSEGIFPAHSRLCPGSFPAGVEAGEILRKFPSVLTQEFFQILGGWNVGIFPAGAGMRERAEKFPCVLTREFFQPNGNGSGGIHGINQKPPKKPDNRKKICSKVISRNKRETRQDPVRINRKWK